MVALIPVEFMPLLVSWVEGLGFRVLGLGLRVLGLGFWVLGLGLRVEGFSGWLATPKGDSLRLLGFKVRYADM